MLCSRRCRSGSRGESLLSNGDACVGSMVCVVMTTLALLDHQIIIVLDPSSDDDPTTTACSAIPLDRQRFSAHDVKCVSVGTPACVTSTEAPAL